MEKGIGMNKQATVVWHLRLFVIILCVVTVASFSSTSHAEPFAVRTLGDYGNVTVMEVTGNYDANNPDGTLNAIPRQEIAKELFRTHKDEYDFLVVFSNFDYQMPNSKAKAFYTHVKNDIRGIGQQVYDYSAFFGSRGKLQGTIDMGNLSALEVSPFESGFETTLATLNHELLHRWGAFVRFREPDGSLSTRLLGEDMKHWSFLVETGGSILYGNKWQDNGNGSFTSVRGSAAFSPLDLYLMGFIGKSQVPQTLLIQNPDVDPTLPSQTGITISGTPRYVTIDEIIAAEGERMPGPDTSQKSFKSAFIFITSPGTFTGDELYGLENVRSGWMTRYSVLTDGAGVVRVAVTPTVDIPGNPGVLPPVITPRQVPSNIDDGVKWLTNSQRTDGSWMDLIQTSMRDSAEAVLALKNFDMVRQNHDLGLQWLNGTSASTTDYLSRKIKALMIPAKEATSLLDKLVLKQNENGGWGSEGTNEFKSNPADTALALETLAWAGYADQSVLSRAIQYLKGSQGPDGGWGSDGGCNIEPTARVLMAFNRFRANFPLDGNIATGMALLLQRQNPDGGFGNSPSTVYDTAIAALALSELNASGDVLNGALRYLRDTQSGDGSWQQSPYQTALAVEALFKAGVESDLAVKNSDIAFTPPVVTNLPVSVVITANISNLGRTDVPRAVVALYDGSLALENKLVEQGVAFPGQATVTVSFSVPMRDGDEHRFIVSVDPDNLLKESNRNNNTAMAILYPQATYDFEVLPTDIGFSANAVDMSQDVTIQTKISNKGTMNAYNVQVRYYIDDPNGVFDVETKTIDIPAGATISDSIIWRTNRSGTDMPLTILVDPFNAFTELAEGNNKASATITVNAAADPNLAVLYKDIIITPKPAIERGTANISTAVRNDGSIAASNVAVNFYKGTPGVDGVLLGSQTIGSINAGESTKVSFDWNNIDDSGERIIYVKVDPDNLITETRKDDNAAFVTLQILSLPDLAVSSNSIVFNPSAPKEGYTVDINVTVKNLGMQAVTNVAVKAYEAGTEIGSKAISSLAGNSQAAVDFSYQAGSGNGVREILIVVDPDNLIPERSKDNNRASRTLGVQDADLWVTERYISPNGDRVKDSTQFFFRLAGQQTVKVIVTNEREETLRTFSGSDLENISGGNITWDGMNSGGTVVDDGKYRLKVIDSNGASVGSLEVTVDNNRTSIIKAIGTKYISDRNMTCRMPTYDGWQWLPNEDGMMFSIKKAERWDYTPAYEGPYTAGLYVALADGTESKITSWEQTIYGWNNPSESWSEERLLDSFLLSPDGSKVIYVLRISSMNMGGPLGCNCPDRQELWLVHADGSNSVMVVSYESKASEWIEGVSLIGWTSDSKAFLYRHSSGWYQSIDPEVFLFNIDDGASRLLESSYATFTFSPDGEVGYFFEDPGTGLSELRISDNLGNMRVGYSLSEYYPVNWLAEKKMIVKVNSGIWIVDTNGVKPEQKLTDISSRLEISPNRKYAVYFQKTGEKCDWVNGEGGLTWECSDIGDFSAADPKGTIFRLSDASWRDCTHRFNEGLAWSPDSRYVMFTSVCNRDGDNTLAIADLARGDLKYLKFGTDLISFDRWLTATDFVAYIEDTRYVVDARSGERVLLTAEIAGLAPFGEAYWHSESITADSGCYKGYYYYCPDGWWSCGYHAKYQDTWITQSLLNLPAQLSVSKSHTAVTLRGVAADLNFEGYKLEYADVKSPNSWSLVQPPSDLMVINDAFTTWVPPYEGTFHVRLTVWDRAGNIATDRKRVSWGLSASISNLYKSNDIFSPNGDGVKDMVSLNYSVLEPVQMEFTIQDETGKLIRAYTKEHATPGADAITWDGRDGSGRAVPDGKYKIKVFDYEFLVEVDNTPPSAGVVMTDIQQDLTTGDVFVELSGHAFDANIKSWAVESRKLEGPGEWTVISGGNGSLAAKDEQGNIVSGRDLHIARIMPSEIVFDYLVGARVRITVEDFAGNISSKLCGPLEERLILGKHEWHAPEESDLNGTHGMIVGEVIRLDSEGPYPSLNVPSTRKNVYRVFEGASSIRSPLRNMRYQLLVGGTWIDKLIRPAPEDRRILQTVLLDIPAGADGIRLATTDEQGIEHYSNIARTVELFAIDCEMKCERTAVNGFKAGDGHYLKIYLKNDLKSLELYEANGMVHDFEASRNDYMPIGKICIGDYSVAIDAVDMIGKQYGIINDCPARETHTALGLAIAQSRNTAVECDSISDEVITIGATPTMPGATTIEARTLSYFIEKPEGPQLLSTLNVGNDGFDVISLDTRGMSEGSYRIKAVLNYLDKLDGMEKEASATDIIIVDRSLPTAKISHPISNSAVCSQEITTSNGTWHEVALEGTADDSSLIKRYEVLYSVGEDSDIWMLVKAHDKQALRGQKPVQGELGRWDVTDLKATDVAVRLRVVDMVGNVGCGTVKFSIDGMIDITALSSDKKLFSPNGDGLMDEISINYLIDENASVDLKVFKKIGQSDGTFTLGATPIRTIVSGLKHISGYESKNWDGADDAGVVLPDGSYGVVVYAKDSCGNTNSRSTVVEIDNTPPTAVITYPSVGVPIGNVVEVRGIADDLNFVNYVLEAGEGDSPSSWLRVGSASSPVRDDVLGVWNTFGLQGMWTLRLTASDVVGNIYSATVTIDLGQRKNLIKDLSVSPAMFSPNGDLRLDADFIKYELTDTCQITLDILDAGSAFRITVASSAAAGVSSYAWNGKDQTETVVADGQYTARLTAVLQSNPSVTQTETVTVVVDATPPAVDIKQPVPDSYLATDVSVFGTISDKHLVEYALSYSGVAGGSIDQGNQNRENFKFAMLTGLPEGEYILNVRAKDQAENITEKNISYTIDRTPPKVSLDTPKEGEYYGSAKDVIDISGSIVDKNLETYSIRYGSGESPTQWTDLQTGSNIPANPQLTSWKVGKNDGIADRVYILSLFAKDKAGLTGEARVRVVIDNTSPEVSILSPKDSDYVKAATDIIGTAKDVNLQKYTIELSEGRCSAAFKWAPIKIGTGSITNSSLGTLQAVPADGNYCLRLTAIDQVQNSSEVKINITIDTTPPAAPALSGKIENKNAVRLTCSSNAEPDLAGYELYRDGVRHNSTLLKDAYYLDSDLKEGIFVYSVKALDQAGNISQPSNEVKMKIDLTGPEVMIRLPQVNARVGGIVDIKGTAFSSEDFKEYRLSVGSGPSPSSWVIIRKSPLPISYGMLAQWDTLGLPEDASYSIKLEAEDINGNIATQQIGVVIDNMPPSQPVLLTAVPAAADVSLTWQANTEADLVGYLLYRNDELVNATGVVVGNLKPHLIPDVSYLDKELLDGKYQYYLAAMDQAGNISNQSNSLEVTIDTHPPHAVIVAPPAGSKFDRTVRLKAESPDNDIASVKFMYRGAQDLAWINLGGAVTKQPFSTYLDPTALSLSKGDYQIMPVATDLSGNADPAPSYITLTYVDVTPPAVILDLKATTVAKDVSLTWTAATDQDLEGYTVYRTSGGSRTKLNAALLKETYHQERGLADGTYTYEVTATDKTGNGSVPSNSVGARVYAPNITQPYTPSDKSVIQLAGTNATAGSSVELFSDGGSGTVSSGTAKADSVGNYSLGLTLAAGENKITAKATDVDGNMSRESELIVVAYGSTPAKPTGLSAAVQNIDVTLTWNANPEQDLAGYNLFRNGEKLNTPSPAAVQGVTASSINGVFGPPENVIDEDPMSSWVSQYSYGVFDPAWVEMALTAKELISLVDIQWMDDWNIGKDFEIQAWSGYAWIPIVKIARNASLNNSLRVSPSYRTDRLRISITDSINEGYYKTVGISEIKVVKDNLITLTSYSYQTVHDGKHSYSANAVSYYGFESPFSDAAAAEVGDVTPPAAPLNLTAKASGLDVDLAWTQNSEPDLAGYNIYRLTPQGWSRISTSLAAVVSFRDTGLQQGTYKYRVTAVDMAGNESLPSNEGSADIYVPDTVAPSRPVLFHPTVSGAPYVSAADKADVAGFGEPGSIIELFRNGQPTGSTWASDSEAVKQYPRTPEANGECISPDGGKLTYTYYDSVWLSDLIGGTSSMIAQSGYNDVWAPSGDSFAYIVHDANWNYHIQIYDLKTSTSRALTEDASADEYGPIWSPDEKQIAFISNRGGSYSAWLKDLTSGAVTQLIDEGDISYVRFSPDGSKLLFATAAGVKVMDRASGDITLIDGQASSGTGEWAANGKRLLYDAYNVSGTTLFVFDFDTKAKTALSDGMNYICYPVWSHDGGSVAFAKWLDNSYSIYVTPWDGQGTMRAIREGLYSLNSLSQLKSGMLTYSDDVNLYTIWPEGSFVFKQVSLDPGDNFFGAIASDATGNMSSPSDGIIVTYDTTSLPDLETTPDDIYLYPEVPISGQRLAVNIVVWNKGASASKETQADIYQLDANGGLQLIKTEVVPAIEAGASEIIGAVWDTTGKIGTSRILVVLDPDDKISEATKANNYAVRDFPVVAKDGISLKTTLQKDILKAAEDISIVVDLANSGIAMTAQLDVQIEDENGYPVAVLKSDAIVLPYGYFGHFDQNWNVDSTLAGSYRVHSVLRNASGILAENLMPFTITADINIKSLITTDKAEYGPNQTVAISVSVQNSGTNYIVPAMTAKVRILDIADNEKFIDSKIISNVLPGSTSIVDSAWNSGLNAPGVYRAIIEIYIDGTIVSGNSSSFKIIRTPLISGRITATPPVVSAGGQVVLDYSATNEGSADAAALVLRVVIVDPETQTVVKQIDETVDIAVNKTVTRQATLSTQVYGLKTYTIVLQDVSQNISRGIASASFAVADVIPPAITVISPLSAQYYNGKIDLIVDAVDESSGVDTVYYQIDGRSWHPMPSPDSVVGRYSIAWTPPQADEGPHTVYFKATDKSGNTSAPVAVPFTVDLTPPVLTVSTLSDGSWTNNEILNVAGKATDNYRVKGVTLNGEALATNEDGTFSYPAVLQDGANMIAITASDMTGNKTTETRTIYLDKTAPVITLTAPADNIKTKQTPIDITGTVDEQSVVTIKVNDALRVAVATDGNSFILSIVPVYGLNTIEAVATDAAGNSSSAKRTFVFDDKNPSLAITYPAQDIKTNQANIALKGEVSDITAITVTMTMDGSIYNPPVVDGKFEQAVAFTTENVYQIYVTAVNEVGNQTVVQRSVVYDITPPVVTIDPVTSPSNQKSQVLTGTNETGAEVIVTCPTSTVGNVTYPTLTTWTSTLTNMREGDNAIAVTSTDVTGNMSLPVTAMILVDRVAPPAPVIISPPDGSMTSTSLVDIRGTAEPGASVFVTGGAEYRTEADPWTGEFMFSQVMLSSGDNIFIFTATDMAGNTGSEARHTLWFGQAELTGTIIARPDAVYQGKDEIFTYTISNVGAVDASAAGIRVILYDQDSQTPRANFEATLAVPTHTSRTGEFVMAIKTLPAGKYKAVLLASAGQEDYKELAYAAFAINPGVEIIKRRPDVTNLLVWINDGCMEKEDSECRTREDSGEGGGDDDGRCIRKDLIRRVIADVVADHHMVFSMGDFVRELRNPYYTDILILGDSSPLNDRHWKELREKVNSGTGLISSLFMRQGEDQGLVRDPILGVTVRGVLPGSGHKVRTTTGPITSPGSFPVSGRALKIEAMAGAAIAGWFQSDGCGEEEDRHEDGRDHDDEGHGKHGEDVRGVSDQYSSSGDHGDDAESQLPAVILHSYGGGRAVFFGFDFGIAINDANFGLLSEMLRKVIRHVHAATDGMKYPGGLLPVQVELRNFGVPYELRITETFPEMINLYDPVSKAWVRARPWSHILNLEAGEDTRYLFYALLPNRAAVYSLRSEISYLEGTDYRPAGSSVIDIVLEGELVDMAEGAMEDLENLGPGDPGCRVARVLIGRVKARHAFTQASVEANIRDLLAALELIMMSRQETGHVRLMLDYLLRGWQSRYYFGRGM